jgi:hypothetical protein
MAYGGKLSGALETCTLTAIEIFMLQSNNFVLDEVACDKAVCKTNQPCYPNDHQTEKRPSKAND